MRGTMKSFAFSSALAIVLALGCSWGASGGIGDGAAFCQMTVNPDGQPPLDIVGACTQGLAVVRWDRTCGGYISVIRHNGPDCSTWSLYDPTTKRWLAGFSGCNDHNICSAGAPGFGNPGACPVGGVADLCTGDGGID
jgi:hypothetical protein